MSGHSKWANIKRQKQAKDLIRGNIFSKLSRLITLAVIDGAGITDPEHNVRLRLALQKAKNLNMPKANIQKAVERGIGPDKDNLKEVVFEGFAAGGVALIILATTDNINRLLSQVRTILEKYNGKLGEQGTINYLFEKCGLISFSKTAITEESVFAFADKIQAFDIGEDETHFLVFFPYRELGKIKDYINNLKYETAEVDFKPRSTVSVKGEKDREKLGFLTSELESLDDVQKVFTNAVW